MSDRTTQRERILALLKAHEGNLVSLSDILDLRIANYRARISEARQQGHNIICRKKRQADGTIHSWYYLTPLSPIISHSEGPAQAYLFGSES